jgi:hypothetical protein
MEIIQIQVVILFSINPSILLRQKELLEWGLVKWVAANSTRTLSVWLKR